MNELTQPAEGTLTVAPNLARDDKPVSVESLLLAAIERGVSVDTLERLMAMRRELKAESAREAYFRDLSAFQAECPVIQKKREVRVSGAVRYKYAALEDISEQVAPLMEKHGFSAQFNTQVDAGFLVLVCKVSHRDGHSEPSEFRVPIEKSGRMNYTQEFGSSTTYAKRYCFCNALGILTGDEDDDAQGTKDAPKAPEAPRNVQKPAPPPKPIPPVKTPPVATTEPKKAGPDELRTWLKGYCDKFLAMAAGETAWAWWAYAVESGWIMPNERLEAARPEDVFKIDWSKSPSQNTPAVRDQYIGHVAAISNLYEGKNRQEGLPTAEEYQAKFAEVYAEPTKVVTSEIEQSWTCPHCSSTATHESKDYDETLVCEACGWQWDTKTGQAWEEYAWASIICPIPPKGMTKKEYDKAPMTLGQLMRVENKRFYGLVMNNQEAKGWDDKNGKHHDPSAADVRFAQACRQAVEHMNASKENTP